MILKMDSDFCTNLLSNKNFLSIATTKSSPPIQHHGTPHSTTYHTTVIHIPQHNTPWHSTFHNIPHHGNTHLTTYQTIVLNIPHHTKPWHSTTRQTTALNNTPHHTINHKIFHFQQYRAKQCYNYQIINNLL